MSTQFCRQFSWISLVLFTSVAVASDWQWQADPQSDWSKRLWQGSYPVKQPDVVFRPLGRAKQSDQIQGYLFRPLDQDEPEKPIVDGYLFRQDQAKQPRTFSNFSEISPLPQTNQTQDSLWQQDHSGLFWDLQRPEYKASYPEPNPYQRREPYENWGGQSIDQPWRETYGGWQFRKE